MLDVLGSNCSEMEEIIKSLRDKLEPVLKQANPEGTSDAPSDGSQQSALHAQLATYTGRLIKMRIMIESIVDRLDIPS